MTEFYLPPPSSKTDWQLISTDFEEIWNLPYVVGAIDGKRVHIQCPNKTGSLYHNYKGFFSLVLLTVYDARYCFTMYDVGHNGSSNDSGILAKSKMSELLDNSQMKIPELKTLYSCNYDPIPYYLVGDKIFPLKTWIMRPYPGKLSDEQHIFNYCLSRTRCVIENTFGILVARWRIFNTPINVDIENAESYVPAAMPLYNYLRLTDNAVYTPQGFFDSESSDGEIKMGEWRVELLQRQEIVSGKLITSVDQGPRKRLRKCEKHFKSMSTVMMAVMNCNGNTLDGHNFSHKEHISCNTITL